MKLLKASEFRTHCLAIIDEVAKTGVPVVITKRGRKVVQLFPMAGTDAEYPQHSLFGTVEVIGDIISPATDPDDWEANRGRVA